MLTIDLAVLWQMEHRYEHGCKDKPSPSSIKPACHQQTQRGQKCVPNTHPTPTTAISEWHMAGDHPLLSAIVSSLWQEHPEGDSSTHPGRGESPAVKQPSALGDLGGTVDIRL